MAGCPHPQPQGHQGLCASSPDASPKEWHFQMSPRSLVGRAVMRKSTLCCRSWRGLNEAWANLGLQYILCNYRAHLRAELLLRAGICPVFVEIQSWWFFFFHQNGFVPSVLNSTAGCFLDLLVCLPLLWIDPEASCTAHAGWSSCRLRPLERPGLDSGATLKCRAPWRIPGEAETGG